MNLISKIRLISGFLLILFFSNHIYPEIHIFVDPDPPCHFTPDLFDKRKNGFKNSMITIAGIIYIALPFSLLSFILFPGIKAKAFFSFTPGF